MADDVLLEIAANAARAIEAVDSFVASTRESLSSLAEAGRINVNATEAREALENLGSLLERTRELESQIAESPVEINVGEARAAIETLQVDLAAVKEELATVGVSPGTEQLIISFREAARSVTVLREALDLDVEQMRGQLPEAVSTATSSIQRLNSEFERLALVKEPVSPVVSSNLKHLNELFERTAANARRMEEELAASGAQQPLNPLVEHMARVTALLGEAFSRMQLDSDSFGRGVQAAMTQAGSALAVFEAEVERTRASGVPIPPETVAMLEAAQAQFVELAGQVVGVRERLEQLQAAGRSSLTGLEAAVQRAEIAMAGLGERTNVASERFAQGLVTAAQRAQAGIAALEQEMERSRAAGDPIPPGTAERLAELRQLYAQLVAEAQRLEQSNRAVRESFGGVTPQAESAGASLKGFALEVVGVYTAVQAAIGFVEQFARRLEEMIRWGTESAIVFQRLKISAEVAFGSLREGADAMEFVRRNALALGVPLEIAAENFMRLSAATRGTRLEGEPTRRMFQEISETLTVLHFNVGEQQQVWLALREMMDRGVVSMQQIHRQLQLIPGATRLAAESLGLTEQAFDKLVRSGTLLSEDFLPKFLDRWHEAFGAGTASAVEAVNAEINRLGNAVLEAGGVLGSELVDPLIAFLRDLRAELEQNQQAIAAFGKALGGVITGLDALFRVAAADLQGLVAVVELGASAVTRLASAAASATKSVADLAIQGGGPLTKGLTESAERAKLLADELERTAKTDFANAVKIMSGELSALSAKLELAKKTASDSADPYKKLKDEIVAGSAAIRQYAADLGTGGTVTQAAADKIVKSIRTVLTEINQLPPSVRKAFEETARELDGLLKHYVVFTTEYEKAQERQQRAAQKTARVEHEELVRREKAFVDFVSKIDEETKKLEGKSDQAAAAKLKRLEDEQRQLSLKPVSQKTGEDDDRLKKLPAEIEAARKELAAAKKEAGETAVAGSEAAVRAGEAILKELEKLVLENKEFRSSFQALSQSGQNALTILINNFAALARAGGVTRTGLQEFTKQLADLLREGGLATGGLAAAFKELSGDSKARLDNLDSTLRQLSADSANLSPVIKGVGNQLGATAGLASQAGSALQGTAQGAKEASVALGTVNTAAAATAQQSKATGDGFIRVHDEAGHATREVGALREEYVRIGKESSEAGGNIVKVGDRIIEVGKNAEGSAGGVISWGDHVVKLGTAAKDTGDAVQKGGDQADKASTQSKKLGDETKTTGDSAASAAPKLKDVGDSAQKAGEGAAKGSEGVDKLAKSAAALQDPLGRVVTSFQALASLKPDVLVASLADAEDRAGVNAGAWAKADDALVVSLTSLGTIVVKTVKDVSDATPKFAALGKEVIAVKNDVADLVKVMNELIKCLNLLKST